MRSASHALAAALTMVAGMTTSSDIGAAEGSAPALPQQEQRRGPTSSVAVYWVGHSLVEGKAASDWGDIDLMGVVGLLAQARGLQYSFGDHTLWGSALSTLWRGKPHSHKRDGSAMLAKRKAFEHEAGRYDTLVATELLPIGVSMTGELSSFYLRSFYCAHKRAMPTARVYLYQTWVNLQGGAAVSGPAPAHKHDWRAAMLGQRADFDRLADKAAKPRVRTPGPFGSRRLTITSNAGCNMKDPILTVPVGSALVELHDRLARPQPADRFELADGSRLAMTDLFANPYVDWPADWPINSAIPAVDPREVIAGLRLRDPTKPHDDIHASAIGIYFAALVHFATLYRRSPVGLPAPAHVGPLLASTLQCIAWETVVRDPRSGVADEGTC